MSLRGRVGRRWGRGPPAWLGWPWCCWAPEQCKQSGQMSEAHLHCSSRLFQQQQQQQQWMVSAAAAELLHDQELTSSRCLNFVTVLQSQQCLAGSQTSLPHNMPEQCTQTCVQHSPHQMVRRTYAIRSQMCWQCHCHEVCSHAFVDDAANSTLYMLQVKHAAALDCHAVSHDTCSVFRPNEDGVVELGGCTWGTHCRS